MSRRTATVWVWSSLLVLASCVSAGRDTESQRSQRVDVVLDRANFDVLSTHNVGRASQDWGLFFFYLGGDAEPLTEAWAELKRKAGVEGRAAAFINVTVDQTEEAVVWPFFWRKVWTVSADAVAFRDPPDAGSGAGAVNRGADEKPR